MKGTFNDQRVSQVFIKSRDSSMNHHSELPSFSVAMGSPAWFPCRDDVTGTQLRFRSMPVQVLNPPDPLFLDHSSANQKNTPSAPLNEHRVASVMEANSDDFDGLNRFDNPATGLDDYGQWSYDDEFANSAQLATLDGFLCRQLFSLEGEPDFMRSAPATGWNPDHHLTNLHTEPPNPEDSGPFAVDKPLNLQQSTSENPMASAENVDVKSSAIERNRERQRERYRVGHADAQRLRERARLRYRNDPDFVEHIKEKQRKRRENPIFAEHERERQREALRERRKNPAYEQFFRERRGKRCINHTAADRHNANRRERYKNDFVYAEGQRIFMRIYKRMKKQVSRGEAARIASHAKEQFLQSVNSTEGSGDK